MNTKLLYVFSSSIVLSTLFIYTFCPSIAHAVQDPGPGKGQRIGGTGTIYYMKGSASAESNRSRPNQERDNRDRKPPNSRLKNNMKVSAQTAKVGQIFQPGRGAIRKAAKLSNPQSHGSAFWGAKIGRRQFVYGRPISGQMVVTSPYGYRIHPNTKKWQLHDGSDLRAKIGTPLYAVKPGRIIKITNAQDGLAEGNSITIRHDDGSLSRYFHLDKRASNLVVGSHLDQGTMIGEAGKTGNAKHPHLHLELENEDGEPINPQEVYPDAVDKE